MKEKETTFFDYYTKKDITTTIPMGSKYDFLLERNAKYMNNIALSFGDRKITYEELHERINEYAKALYHHGIRKGDKIGVCLVNSPEAIYVLYALDIIGAVIVGLSPMNNEYKMRRDIEMTKPSRIITADILYSNIKNSCDALHISPILFTPGESLNNTAEDNFNPTKLQDIYNIGKKENMPHEEYTPDTLSDILFTGGSTGVHKGVELSSNGLNGVVKAVDYVFDLEPGMKHLGNIPFGHMVFGRFVMHYALCKNLEFALTLNALPQHFLEEIIRTESNGAMGGPVHWDNLENNPLLPNSIPFLTQAVTGGEMLKPEKRREIIKNLQLGGSQAEISDGLGLTEMWAPTHIGMGKKNTAETIGFAIPFVTDKIVNPKLLENYIPGTKIDLKEVEPGQNGLLLVNGPGMMLKYHNNPEETDKVFFYDLDGTKYYCTGDMVTRTGLYNKECKFSGRQKRNFVCGVDNIYPEQIEKLLTTLPEIKEAIITKIPDSKYQFLPKYHICLAEECDLKELQLKIEALIESTLGESALPGYIDYTFKPFQRTDNGKLNATILQEEDLKQYQEQNLKLIRKVY